MANTYRIGQAAEILGLRTSVLRYWESEFPQLEPVRTAKGQRLYTDEHLRLLAAIKDLLHNQGMTIEGARKRLEDAAADIEISGLKQELAGELKAIRRLLTED